jgi:hypothetical protein
VPTGGPIKKPIPEPTMTDQQQNEISNENRNMWIAVGVIVALLAGGMGINALVHHEPATSETVQPSGSSN